MRHMGDKHFTTRVSVHSWPDQEHAYARCMPQATPDTANFGLLGPAVPLMLIQLDAHLRCCMPVQGRPMICSRGIQSACEWLAHT